MCIVGNKRKKQTCSNLVHLCYILEQIIYVFWTFSGLTIKIILSFNNGYYLIIAVYIQICDVVGEHYIYNGQFRLCDNRVSQVQSSSLYKGPVAD